MSLLTSSSRILSCLAFTSFLACAGCSFDLGELGEICLDGAGYQPGRAADEGSGTLAGTHVLVGVDLFALGAEEGVLITTPASENGGPLITTEGPLQIVDQFAQCDSGDQDLRKVHIAATAVGEGKIVVKSGDGTLIAAFHLPVTTATVLEIVDGAGPFVVNQPKKVCAVARDDMGRLLYVDDAMTWSSTGSVTLSILDPGQACHTVTPTAAGTFDLSVSALGLTTTLTLDAVDP